MSVSRKIFRDKEELAKAGAERIILAAKEAIKTQGKFSLVLSGGSTPKAIYRLLAETPERIDWKHVSLFFGDERMVPKEHIDSNYRMAKESFLDHVPIPKEQIHRMAGEKEPAVAAKEYEDLLVQGVLSEKNTFDLVLLGMGDDGHTASLFPDTKALEIENRLVIENHVEKLDTYRVTLTPKAILQSKAIVFFIAGENKADTLVSVLEGEFQPKTFPSQLIFSSEARVELLLDSAAAAKLSNAP